jgi:O-methyltransferase
MPSTNASRSPAGNFELTPLANRYLSLLSDTLRNRFYREPPESPLSGPELERARNAIEAVVREFAEESERLRSVPAITAEEMSLRALLVDPDEAIIAGFFRANSPTAYTVLDAEALENLKDCIVSVLRDNVPGDLMECGVFRGGAAIYMRGVLAALEVEDRKVWLADSFQGLPQPERLLDSVVHAYLKAIGSFIVGFYEVMAACSAFDLLDDKMEFLPGWFDDTLPGLSHPLAVLRCDGDWYGSTLTILESLYDQVSPGGFVIIDDYNPVFGAYQAVNEFRAQKDIQAPIIPVAGNVHYWRKDYVEEPKPG